MIVGTPLPGSPTIRAHAPCSSSSLEALERLPSLSFRRWMWNALRLPSGRMRGSRKHDSPSSVWASTRKMSDIGAEQNHLWPVISYSPPPPPPFSGVATVVLARTSEPPCFSVIAMPAIALAFSPGARSSGSYVRAIRRGSHSAASSGWARSAGTTANVIVIGQANPASACIAVMYSAARAVCEYGCSLVQGRECNSFSIPIRMSSCQAG